MKMRWKAVLIATAVIFLPALLFGIVFSGINLDDGMIVRHWTRQGVVWVGMDGDPRNRHVEPLAHFLPGLLGLVAVVWVLATMLMGPVAYLLGYLIERRRTAQARQGRR